MLVWCQKVYEYVQDGLDDILNILGDDERKGTSCGDGRQDTVDCSVIRKGPARLDMESSVCLRACFVSSAREDGPGHVESFVV